MNKLKSLISSRRFLMAVAGVVAIALSGCLQQALAQTHRPARW
jgi:hypothetical protein